MRTINVYDGKYTVLLSEDCSTFEALRNGEKWRDLCGDGLVLQLCLELLELQTKISGQGESQNPSDNNAMSPCKLFSLNMVCRRGRCYSNSDRISCSTVACQLTQPQ